MFCLFPWRLRVHARRCIHLCQTLQTRALTLRVLLPSCSTLNHSQVGFELQFLLGSGKTGNEDVRSAVIWFLREKAGEGGGEGALYSHMAVSPCGKKVFLTLNSKIAKCLSISGRSVIAKSNTGGGEGKSEALGTRQAKLLEGRVHGMNSSNSHRH